MIAPTKIYNVRYKIEDQWNIPSFVMQKVDSVWEVVYEYVNDGVNGYVYPEYTFDETDETSRGVTFSSPFTWDNVDSLDYYFPRSTADYPERYIITIPVERSLIGNEDTVSVSLNISEGSSTPIRMFTAPNPTTFTEDSVLLEDGLNIKMLSEDFNIGDNLVFQLQVPNLSSGSIDNIQVGAETVVPFEPSEITVLNDLELDVLVNSDTVLEIDTYNVNSENPLYAETYQWYVDGVAINGATDKTLTINSAEVKECIYWCVVEANTGLVRGMYQSTSAFITVSYKKGYMAGGSLYTNAPAMILNDNSSAFFSEIPAMMSEGSRLLIKFTTSSAALTFPQRIVHFYDGNGAYIAQDNSLYISSNIRVKDNLSGNLLTSQTFILETDTYYELEVERMVAVPTENPTVAVGTSVTAKTQTADIYLHELHILDTSGGAEVITVNVEEGKTVVSNLGTTYDIINTKEGSTGDPTWIPQTLSPYEKSTNVVVQSEYGNDLPLNLSILLEVSADNINEEIDTYQEYFQWYKDGV